MAHQAKKHRQEERRNVVSSAAAEDDGDNKDNGDDEHLLASSIATAPPLPRFLLDELDDGEPLSTIQDDSSYPDVFYKEVPHASSSRVPL